MILRLRQTRVGSFIQETLDKASPQAVLPNKEFRKMLELHRHVVLWAAENLTLAERRRFSTNLQRNNYDGALAVLMDEFHRNGCITLWERRRWVNWRDNFAKGFVPGV